jgi:glycosyltransferase involved in cell wall biosynthesis
LRVLLVAPGIDILGGQAVQAARLLARLRAEPTLEVGFLPINPPFPAPLRRWQGIKYVRSLRTSLLYWLALAREVRRYDVLHIFSASYFSFVISPTPAILAGKLCGKRTLLNYRSGEAADHLQRWATAVSTLKWVDEVVVPSGYLVDVFARFGIGARSIFNIVETDRFRFRARRPLRPHFLSNRNLEPLYNVGCVLRAFAAIQARFPDARLTVAGDGSQRSALEQLARTLRLHNVAFIGRVAPERMPALYDAADIYLNSSDIDNMPGSIIEAFAAGLPVVTTDAGGIAEAVQHGTTGLVAAPRDVAALARHLGELVGDPLRRRAMGCAGRRTVEEGFDVERSADELVARFSASAREAAR